MSEEKKYAHIEWEVDEINNILEVRVPLEDKVFYFRDIKGREIKLFENTIKLGITLSNTIPLMEMLLLEEKGSSRDDLRYMEFDAFEELFDVVLHNIILDMIPWFDFLEVAYALGKKSYSVLPFMLDCDLTTIKDMIHSAESYNKKEEEAIKEMQSSK